jgi:AraC-like DNA-binding protein/effector-binding domain-containing protein
MSTRVRPLLRFAVRHLDRDLSLSALAERAGLSPFHLQRLFRDLAGESVKQYALRLRLDRAASRLLGSAESVLAIALSSGFRNHETFTRAFRRRFGLSPLAYRKRGLLAGRNSKQNADHIAWIRRVSPCIRLFRTGTPSEPAAPGSRHGTQENNMPYDISRRELSPQPVLVIRKRIKRSEVAANLAQLFGRIFEHTQRNGITLAGQPFLRIQEWGPGMLLIDAGLQVTAPAKGEGDIKADTLPGGPAAATVHAGLYEGLPRAHAAVQVWIEDNGWEPGAPPWETYVTDPAEYPDPKDWKTDVVWPLAR